MPVFLEYAQNLEFTHIKGLMTVAPKVENGDPDVHFKNMKDLFDNVRKQSYKNVTMTELSMGMSGDYEIAIRYGATMVRIGSAIFGPRNYN